PDLLGVAVERPSPFASESQMTPLRHWFQKSSKIDRSNAQLLVAQRIGFGPLVCAPIGQALALDAFEGLLSATLATPATAICRNIRKCSRHRKRHRISSSSPFSDHRQAD